MLTRRGLLSVLRFGMAPLALTLPILREKPTPAQRLINQYFDRHSLSGLGAKCRKALGCDDAAGLESIVLSRLAACHPRCPASSLANASSMSLATRFAAAVEADFERNDIVIVDGWILARTEATLAAVVA